MINSKKAKPTLKAKKPPDYVIIKVRIFVVINPLLPWLKIVIFSKFGFMIIYITYDVINNKRMKGHRIFSYFDKHLKKNLGGKGLSKFRLVKSYKEFASGSFHSDHAMVLGNYMFLDVKDAMDLSRNGIYEPMSTKIIQNEIHESDIVVDIGANIGYYTLIMAKLVGGGQSFFL